MLAGVERAPTGLHPDAPPTPIPPAPPSYDARATRPVSSGRHPRPCRVTVTAPSPCRDGGTHLSAQPHRSATSSQPGKSQPTRAPMAALRRPSGARRASSRAPKLWCGVKGGGDGNWVSRAAAAGHQRVCCRKLELPQVLRCAGGPAATRVLANAAVWGTACANGRACAPPPHGRSGGAAPHPQKAARSASAP